MDIIDIKIIDTEKDYLYKEEIALLRKLPAHRQYIVLNKVCSLLIKNELAKQIWDNMYTNPDIKTKILNEIICYYPQENLNLLEYIGKDFLIMPDKIPSEFIHSMHVQKNEEVWEFIYSHYVVNEKILKNIISTCILNRNENALEWILNNQVKKNIICNESILLQTLAMDYKEQANMSEMIVNYLAKHPSEIIDKIEQNIKYKIGNTDFREHYSKVKTMVFKERLEDQLTVKSVYTNTERKRKMKI